MKILILGKTGQLGYSIISNAKVLDYSIISLSRKELDIVDIINKKNKKFLNLLNVIKPDVVINTAAYNNVNEAEINQIYAFNINCIAVKNMAEICSNLNIQFITFSTDYIFDGKKGYSYIETDIPQPLNVYGLSKLAGEYGALEYDTSIIIRTCGLYGLNSLSTKSGKGNFINNRIADSIINKSITIVDDQIVSPTYTEDLALAVLKLINIPTNIYNIFHFVNDGYCSWAELTTEIYNILNIDTKVIPIKTINQVVKRPQYSALNNINGKKIGIKLPHWKDALKRYLNNEYIKNKS